MFLKYERDNRNEFNTRNRFVHINYKIYHSHKLQNILNEHFDFRPVIGFFSLLVGKCSTLNVIGTLENG